ncbi:hypothetical protein HZS55_08995 [Halosimplex rubrum]|uniref:Uncharacterized protein n=1 Tax=Halosimplex rubrum TaxID=869889 RepID=A0A7D5NZL0_9EURY|nr:hypothetical protein [Halosimplex rubrum]QLH77423.1 hypothetical protein HZS55_08995 [Halosimplex rubrum]
MSLDEGMLTAADIVGLLEDHGVDVEDASDIATTVDGDHVRATFSVTAPIGLSLEGEDAASEDEADQGPATDDDVAAEVEQVEADSGATDDVDELTESIVDDEDGDDADQDGRDDEVLPTFDELVDEDESDAPDDDPDGGEGDAGAEPAPETEGSDGGEDDTGDETEDMLGIATAKSYGTTLNGTVADHFDTDRVTVVDQPYGADLIPGTDAEGPDYAVGRNKVQLGDPGRREIGVDVEEEIRAIADGDSVRLEPVDGAVEEDDDEDEDQQDDEDVPEHDPETVSEPQPEDNGEDTPEPHSEPEEETAEEDSEADDPTEADESDAPPIEFWCGHCGAGPESSQADVRDHHGREDHPGEPVVLSEHPAEADVIENGGPDRPERSLDRVLRERVLEYLLGHARDGDRFFKPEDIAFALDEPGNDVVDVLNDLVEDRREVVKVRPVGVSGQMWCARLAAPGKMTEGEIHSVAEASESVDEAAENFEVSVDYARTVLEAHECLDDVVDDDQEVAAADD